MSSHPARVAVRARPGSSRNAVGGSHGEPPALVVAVTSPAIDGRATESVRRALAEALGVRRSAVVLVSGATSRDKVFEIADPPADLEERVAALLVGR